MGCEAVGRGGGGTCKAGGATEAHSASLAQPSQGSRPRGDAQVNSLQARGGRQCYIVVELRLVKCSEGREGGGSVAVEEVGGGHQG